MDEYPLCVFPALTYWEFEGAPISSQEAKERGWFKGGCVLKETEVAKKLPRIAGFAYPIVKPK